MNSRERLLITLRFEKADRVPLLGGWILGDWQHQAITGCTEEEYWRDPLHYVIEAHRVLGVDGMIAVHVPKWPGQYRGDLTREKFESYKERFPAPEDVLAFARSQPTAVEAARCFDAEGWRDEFRSNILALQRKMGDVVYLPTLWEEVHPRFEWYQDFGYENYLLFMHLYPEEANHFFESLAAVTRRKAEMAVQVYQELDLVPLTLIGTDICGRDGPLISPELLREIYFPHTRYSLEPLREVGIKTVWHSDGDFRPLIEDILACGVDGFQGFQEEYGVDIAGLARHRTVDGEKLILWAGPSVTSTLPYGSVEDVRRDIERIINTLADECALFILPANNVLPDCPVENIIAMHRHTVDYGSCRLAGQ
jgi:hypothetical protein